MKLTRLYVPELPGHDHSITLPPDRSHYLARVLRLTRGDLLRVFDGSGREFEALIDGGGHNATVVRLQQAVDAAAESPLDLRLAQGLCRGDRMDLVLQKATELGVAEIVPLNCSRTQVKLDGRRLQKRMAHWRAVVISACEQSGRAVLPRLAPLRTLPDYLAANPGADPAAHEAKGFYLDPGSGQRIRDQRLDDNAVRLVVGPEGGLTEPEREALRSAGFQGLNLGPRVLRTETAGLAAIASLQSHFGDC